MLYYFLHKLCALKSASMLIFLILIDVFVDFSEAKNCLVDKHIAFIGDSRIRQLFYSFVKIINPQFKEEGNKVNFVYSFH